MASKKPLSLIAKVVFFDEIYSFKNLLQRNKAIKKILKEISTGVEVILLNRGYW